MNPAREASDALECLNPKLHLEPSLEVQASLPANEPRSREEQRIIARAGVRHEATADKIKGGAVAYAGTLNHFTSAIMHMADKWHVAKQAAPERCGPAARPTGILNKTSFAYFDRVAELGRSTDDPNLKRRCHNKMARFLGLDKSESESEVEGVI